MNKYQKILKEVKNEFKQYLKNVNNNEENYKDEKLLEIIDKHLILNASKLKDEMSVSYKIDECVFEMFKLFNILKGINKSYLKNVEVSFEQESFEKICIAIIRGKIWEDVYDIFWFEIDNFCKETHD